MSKKVGLLGYVALALVVCASPGIVLLSLASGRNLNLMGSAGSGTSDKSAREAHISHLADCPTQIFSLGLRDILWGV